MPRLVAQTDPSSQDPSLSVNRPANPSQDPASVAADSNQPENQGAGDPALSVNRGSDENGDHSNDGGDQDPDCDHPHKSQLAFMEANPNSFYPTAPLMRQPHKDGQLYPLTNSQIFNSDYLLHFTQRVNSLASQELVEIDCISPNSESNKTAKHSAATLVVKFRGSGSSPSAINATSQVEWKRFDSRTPEGKVVYSARENFLQSFLKIHGAVALGKDLGDWKINISRNGTQLSSTTVTVVQAPSPSSSGWSRRVNNSYQSISSPLVAYTTDDGVIYSPAPYPIPTPSSSSSDQTFKVKWKFVSPEASENRSEGAYANIEEVYRTDGSVWNTTTVVKMPGYRDGRVIIQSGTGALQQLPSPSPGIIGLPHPGTWNFIEKAGEAASTTTSLEVRQLIADAVQVLPGAFVDTQLIPYKLKFRALPASWLPSEVDWTLALVDGNGNTVRKYTGQLSNVTSNVTSVIQDWNCQDDNGNPVPTGGTITAIVSASVPQPPQPQARTAAVPQSNSTTPALPYMVTRTPDGQVNITPLKSSMATSAAKKANATPADSTPTFLGSPGDIWVVASADPTIGITHAGSMLIAVNSLNTTGTIYTAGGSLVAQSPFFANPTQDQPFVFNIPNTLPLYNISFGFVDGSGNGVCGYDSAAYLYDYDNQGNFKSVTQLTPDFSAECYSGLGIFYGFPPPSTTPPNSSTSNQNNPLTNPATNTAGTCGCVGGNGDTSTMLTGISSLSSYGNGVGTSSVGLNGITSGTSAAGPQVGDTQVGPTGNNSATVSGVSGNTGDTSSPDSCSTESSPIPIRILNGSGRYSHGLGDLAIPTRGLPLVLGRLYSSEQQNQAPHFGWRWTFEDSLTIEPTSGNVFHVRSDGHVSAFTNNSGTYTPTETETREVVTQLDDHHYQIMTKGKVRVIYEVPAHVTLPSSNFYSAHMSKEIDSFGNTNTFKWDDQGKRLQRIEGPDSSIFLKLSWSSDRGPDKVFDQTGRCVVYRYKSFQRHDECRHEEDDAHKSVDWVLSKVVQPGKTTFTYGYHKVLGERRYPLLTTCLNGVLQEKVVGNEDTPGVLLEVSHLLAATVAFSRNNSGTSTLTINAADVPQQVLTYALNSDEKPVQVTDAAGRQSSQTIDEQDDVTSTTDTLGHQTVYTFDARRNPLSVTDALNHTTKMEWDLQDNLRVITDARQQKVKIDYNSTYNPISVTDQAMHTSTATYTSFGKIKTATDPLLHTWSFQYNELGFLSGKSAPPSAPGQPQATWVFSVDSLGRTVMSTDPLGRVSKTRFDERNRPVESTIPAVSAQFRQVELPEAKTTAEFDKNDLLLSTTAPDGLVTKYGYDAGLKLISVLPPGTTTPTLLKYDGLERVAQMTNSDGKTTSYQRDPLNRLVKTVFPGGNTETYGYDVRNRLSNWNRGAYSVTYTYNDINLMTKIDSPTISDSISLDYDDLNRVSLMKDNSGKTSYAYTPTSLLDSVTHPGNKALQYSRDPADRVTSILDPEALTTTLTYSDRNELNTVTHDGQTVSYLHDLVGRTYQANYPNGTSATQSFSERDQLLFKEYDKGSSPLLTLKYGFNQVGQRVVGEQSDATGSTISRYGYNNRRQLIASSRDGAGGHSGFAYSLDQNDNVTNDNGTPFTSNGADQLTKAGSTALSYNGAGQATSVGQLAIQFAYNDQIKSITGPGLNAQYLYDGNGQRVQKTVNGVVQKFLWNGGSIAKEYKADGSVHADYQLGAGAKIDGKWQFYLSDIQGSTLGVTDDTGKVVATWGYSDYGVTTQTSGDHALYQPFLYTHSELDSETGFYHNKARHYAPALGKFLARDPAGSSSNLYSYCGGDPINFSDRSGLKSISFDFWVAVAVTGTDGAVIDTIGVDVTGSYNTGTGQLLVNLGFDNPLNTKVPTTVTVSASSYGGGTTCAMSQAGIAGIEAAAAASGHSMTATPETYGTSLFAQQGVGAGSHPVPEIQLMSNASIVEFSVQVNVSPMTENIPINGPGVQGMITHVYNPGQRTVSYTLLNQ